MDSPQETQQAPKQEHTSDPGTRPDPPRDTLWRRKPAYPEDPRFKSPAVATFLSLVPGLGQIYVGYYRQGFINIIMIGTLVSVLSLGEFKLGALMPLLVFFVVFYWLYNLVDAARRAAFYNQALSGIAVTELPPDFRMPEKYGSLPGGIVLILLGALISSYTLFGYSLEWTRRWWPMALILFGAYLVYQAIAERKRKT